MSRLRTLLHPATGIAILALVVSLGSGAVAAGLITGADIKNDSVTGKDVKESSLAKVPAAKNADKVGGVQVKRIRLVGASPVGATTILRLNSFSLVASCTGGVATVTAKTTSGDAELSWEAVDASDDSSIDQNVDSFTSASPVDLDFSNVAHSDIIGHLRYVASNGDTAVVELSEEDGFAGADCVLTGSAIG
ncbi:hypothetical protein [Nocardioides taihuensis]|uniref:Cholesterol esterase n=1 Tax=Nocardioides taihuensis TaxID=1835606 RepID=A0ABW0BNI5_9ACTN